MIIVALIISGLAFGSFVNALVWRLRQQLDDDGIPKKLSAKQKSELSISTGRSMCPNCKHTLSANDLIPVVSWLLLGGKCRYCHKAISHQYPIVELLTAILFVVSFIAWPTDFQQSWQIILFINWLVAIVGMVALVVYDLKWMLLPDKILMPLFGIAGIATVTSFILGRPLQDIKSILLSIAIGGGIFWLLFQISKGKWIGGGDVKLGLYLGLILAAPWLSFISIFAASILGTLFVLPLLALNKVNKTSPIPFGPFLMMGAYISMLWGGLIVAWYTDSFLNF